MKEVTITLFVHPNSLMTLLPVLKILDPLDIENDYTFTPTDIVYSEVMVSNYMVINVPINLYMKFKYSYHKLKNY